MVESNLQNTSAAGGPESGQAQEEDEGGFQMFQPGDAQRRGTVQGSSQTELKRNYKLLKKAFKEEREFRAGIENELRTKIKQYNDQAIQIEELKDRNLELYEANMVLEE